LIIAYFTGFDNRKGVVSLCPYKKAEKKEVDKIGAGEYDK